MANKLTNEKLKELIMEVLSEQVLNEKKGDLPFDIDGLKKDDIVDDIYTSSHKKKYTGSKRPTKSAYKNLAKLSGDDSEIEVSDYIAADPNDQVIKNIVSHGRAKHKAAAIKAAGGSRGGSITALTDNDVTALNLSGTKAEMQDQFGDYNTATAPDKTIILANLRLLFNALPDKYSSGKLSKAVKKKKWFEDIDQLLGGPPPPTKNLSTALTTAFKKLQLDMVPTKSLAGRLDIPVSNLDTAAVTDAEGLVDAAKSALGTTPALPEHLINTFNLFQRDIIGVWEDMAAVANIINTGTGFPTSRTEALKFIAKANLVIKIGNLSKRFNSSAAGFEFEKICAALFNGMNMGGINGAVDVYTKMASGRFLFTSQKSLVEAGDVTQSAGGTADTKYGLIDIFRALKAKGMPQEIYYVIIKKQGGAETYESINIHFMRVMPPTTGYKGNFAVEEYNPSTKNFVVKNSSTSGKDLSISEANVDTPVAKIPLLKNPSASVSAIAEFTKDQMTKAGGEMKKQIEKVQSVVKKLENLEMLTTSYTAKADEPVAAQDYVDKISQNYVDLDTKGFGELFTTTEKSGTVFTENKKNQTKSLKDLDKLIERVILESMNKK
jgi:hypothetical protein